MVIFSVVPVFLESDWDFKGEECFWLVKRALTGDVK